MKHMTDKLAQVAPTCAVVAGGARGSAYLITLGSFVLFYVTSRLGLAFALRGLPAPIAAFLPDIVIALLSIPLIRRLRARGIPLVR